MLLKLYLYFRMEMNSGTVLGHFLQALPIACIAGLVFFAIRFARLRKRKEQIDWGQEMLRVVFVCYLTGLISLVVLPANFWLSVYDGIFLGWWNEVGQVFRLGGVSLVPAVIRCLRGELSLGSWVKTMLLGNAAMFVPLGFFLPLVARIRSVRRLVAAAVAAPLCFETVQLFFGRIFDVDDLLCNFTGIVLGATLACVMVRKGG